MNKAEILAPAGGMDSLIAAVRCSADAVYFGGKTLNARRNAGNFEDDELQRAVEYCHSRGVKAYITLNTLAFDNELSLASEFIKRACTIGADALILQDLGLASLVKEVCDIPMHASTQMSVLSLEGVEKLGEAGFCRAVLPRELSRTEMKKIVESTHLETEVFVHGALCMCVSGQCCMSAVLGSRSGNRGLCAQPCRLPFAAKGGTGNDLSLKDLSLLSHLREMQSMGVTSFKIEGRMKRPEYVAAAVTACRMALDGEVSENISEALRDVFSRSGFTDGYYIGKTGIGMFGVRTKKDVVSSAQRLPELEKLYEREHPCMPVRFHLECKSEQPAALTAQCLEKSVTVYGEVPQTALSRALDGESVAQQLKKCGATQFFAEEITSDIANAVYLPASAVNALRRDAMCELDIQLAHSTEHSFMPHKSETLTPHKSEDTSLYACFYDVSQIPQDIGTISKIILPIRCKTEDFVRYDAAVLLPRAIFGSNGRVRERLRELAAAGVKRAVCGTLDGIVAARAEGFEVTAGIGTNLCNTRALEAIAKLGVDECVLSAELTINKAARLGGEMRRGVLAYGNLPLMLTRNCPAANGTACGECAGKSFLTDRLSQRFPVTCASGCAEVLNSRPVYMADRQPELRVFDFLLLLFTVQTREECAAVLESFKNGSPAQGEFTRGLYYRGVE